MQQTIFILNGPNLNLLGQRDPEIYGHTTLDGIEFMCKNHAQSHQIQIQFYQSNYEGQLIDWIHEAVEKAQAILINPAGLGHTSVSLYDALDIFSRPKIEVHLSNIYKREEFRHHSYTAKTVDGVISGLSLIHI